MEISMWNEQAKVPVTVFHLKGDLASEEPLETRAKEAFEAGGRDFLLDLTDVPFVSSAGLRALHSVYMMLRDADPADAEASAKGLARGTYKSPHLKLLNVSRNAKKALSVAGYDMFLDMFDSRQKALDSFG